MARKFNPKIGAIPKDLILRSEFMERAGITVREMNALAQSGSLKPARRSARGWALYSIDDVERVRRTKVATVRTHAVDSSTYSAGEAAKVFKLLDQGHSFAWIVAELEMHPYVVEAIMKEHARGSGGVFVEKVVLDKINRLPIEGVTLPITSADHILLALEVACVEKRCPGCRRRSPSSQCSTCLRKVFEQEQAKKAELAAQEAEKTKAVETAETSASAAQ